MSDPLDDGLALLELPDPVLVALTQALDPVSCMEFFRCCTTTRNMVLSHRPVQLILFPTRSNEPDSAMRHSLLLLACSLGRDIRLTVSAFSPRTRDAQAKASSDAQHSVCLTVQYRALVTEQTQQTLQGVASKLGGPLAAVTSISLEGLLLNGVMPAWLAATCPNLQRLALRDCSIRDLPPANTTLQPHPRVEVLSLDCLQELELQPMPFLEIGGILAMPCNTDNTDRWLCQLKTLPGLRRFKSSVNKGCHWPFVRCLGETVGPQLAHLTLDMTWSSSPRDALAQLGRFFPTLEHLVVPGVTVTGELLLAAVRQWGRLQRLQGKALDLPEPVLQHAAHVQVTAVGAEQQGHWSPPRCC